MAMVAAPGSPARLGGRRRLAAVLVLLAATATALVLVLSHDGDGREPGGPLQPRDGGYDVLDGRVDPGGVYTEAMTLIVNPGRRDAVIEAVRPAGIAVEGRAPRVRVFLAGRGSSRGDAAFGADTAFPPDFLRAETIKPAAGYRLAPSRTPEGAEGAVVVARLTMPPGRSRYSLRGYEVDYRVGRDRYRAVLPHGLVVCAAPRARCDSRPHDLAPLPIG